MLRFIQLACESASQGLDRRRTGHYRCRAGVGSASKAVNFRTQPWLLVPRMGTACRRRLPVHPSPPEPSYSASGSGCSGPDHGLVLPESEPVTVSIPKIGVRSRLVDLGLDEQGSMEVPVALPELAGSLEVQHQVH